jgi:hypothetical protein
MPRIAKMVAVGRLFLQSRPHATEEELRSYLRHEFQVERNPEIVLLRSGIWPLALVIGFVRDAWQGRRSARIEQSVEAAILELRTRQAP